MNRYIKLRRGSCCDLGEGVWSQLAHTLLTLRSAPLDISVGSSLDVVYCVNTRLFMKKDDVFPILFSEDGASMAVAAGSWDPGLCPLPALSCPWR